MVYDATKFTFCTFYWYSYKYTIESGYQAHFVIKRIPTIKRTLYS